MPDNDQTTGQQPNENPNLARLREKADRADALEVELAASKRETAIVRSGIDAESPLGKLFLRGFDGDPTDVEALTAAAREVGVPFRGEQATTSTTSTGDQPTGEQQAPESTGTEERQTLAGGAPPDTGVDPDPRQVARDNFEKRVATGRPVDESSAYMLNELANAANRGDSRVLIRDNV